MWPLGATLRSYVGLSCWLLELSVRGSGSRWARWGQPWTTLPQGLLVMESWALFNSVGTASA